MVNVFSHCLKLYSQMSLTLASRSLHCELLFFSGLSLSQQALVLCSSVPGLLSVSEFQLSSCPMAAAPQWQTVLQEIQGSLLRLEEQVQKIQEDCLDVLDFSRVAVIKF